jgi:hypothetical protein
MELAMTEIDANDDRKEWDETEIEDLQNSLAYGSTIEETAVMLCRSGTINDVRRKADELGLTYRSAPLPPAWPTHKITGTRLYEIDHDTHGVEYSFDDGTKVAEGIGSRAQAEYAAHDRIGDPIPIVPRPAS